MPRTGRENRPAIRGLGIIDDAYEHYGDEKWCLQAISAMQNTDGCFRWHRHFEAPTPHPCFVNRRKVATDRLLKRPAFFGIGAI